MSNSLLQTITILLLLVHAAVLLWAVLRRGSGPAVWLNLSIALAVWLYWSQRLGEAFENNLQGPMLIFELVTAATSIAVLRGIRVPLFVVWSEFAVHACAAGLAVVFAFTFSINRLF